MRDILPHYLKNTVTEFHNDLCRELGSISHQRGQQRNWVAPRGSGKTSYLSKGYPLYGALEGIEPLTVLCAETGELARGYLDSIKQEIETNPAIERHYPHVAGRGPLWQSARIRLRNGCEIIARGSGGRILGVTRRDRRPTLVVVDDGNQRGDAYSPTLRQRKLDWFNRDVLPVGEPGTNFVVSGTAIHRDAIVCHLRRAGWKTQSYKALLHEPDNAELWRHCERLLTDLTDERAESTALEFYTAHRAEMDAGAELLWPDRLSLWSLMRYRALSGEQAFKSEYQDDPGSPEGAEWPGELFEVPGFWFFDWPELVCKVIALDPSKGNDARQGDYQAHALIGLGKDGNLYIESVLRRETPEAMCERAIELAQIWQKVDGLPVNSVVVEDNGTMGLIEPAIRLAAEKLNAKLIPWECLTNKGSKDLRIRKVSAYLHTKRIRVRSTTGGRMLVEQWREFPNGDHDDGPDAVATGITRLEQLMG